MAFTVACTILKNIEDKNASIKTLIHQSEYKNKKELYALVCETLRYRTVVDELIETTNLLKEVKPLQNNPWLAKVLVYALLFGSGVYGKQKASLSKHKSALTSALARLKIKKKAVRNEDLLESDSSLIQALPRYVRVNTIKLTVKEVVEAFKKEGYSLLPTPKDYAKYTAGIKCLKSKEFMQDISIPEILVFCSSSAFHNHTLYKDGGIILQDKASCLPAFILAEGGIASGSNAIDSCAAPGNKTSHLAAMLKNKGTIFAFDKDTTRMKTMKGLLEKAGVSNVDMLCSDFLKIKPASSSFKNVQYAIVDPSCSGSGIVSRLSGLIDDASSSSDQRLQQLASFQRRVLAHALSFPAMKRVVYSTCSVHEQENEEVVRDVHELVKDFFDVVKVAPSIPSRGLSSYDLGSKCLRLSPENDATNGFFVACFQRKEGAQGTIDCSPLWDKSVEKTENSKVKKGKKEMENGGLNTSNSDLTHHGNDSGAAVQDGKKKKTTKGDGNSAIEKDITHVEKLKTEKDTNVSTSAKGETKAAKKERKRKQTPAVNQQNAPLKKAKQEDGQKSKKKRRKKMKNPTKPVTA